MSDGGAGAEATPVSVLLRPDKGGKREEGGTTRGRLAEAPEGRWRETGPDPSCAMPERPWLRGARRERDGERGKINLMYVISSGNNDPDNGCSDCDGDLIHGELVAFINLQCNLPHADRY